jgi:hypothetical protein
MHQASKWIFSACTAALALCAVTALCGTPTRAAAAPTLEQLMADFDFSTSDVQRVRAGEMVKSTAKETSEKELATVMVFLVNAPVQKLQSSFEVGAGFRNDPQVQSAIEIKGDGTLADFKDVVLQPGGDKEMKRYLDAAPGDTLNLSLPEIAAFQALKQGGAATQAQVEEALRKQLLGRYQAYRSQGLAGIAPYARGKDKQSQPADTLRRATEAATGIKKYAPAFYDVVLHYPQGKPAGFSERFFCIRYAMDGRPNFTLRHRMAMPLDDAYVLVDREFYVSHEYNETQAVAGLLPVTEGTVVAYLNRVTTDQLGGFGASAKQSIGRSLMSKQIAEIFEKGRAKLKGK